jgi:hypothetical protein
MSGDFESLSDHEWDCITLGEWKRLQAALSKEASVPLGTHTRFDAADDGLTVGITVAERVCLRPCPGA